MVLQETFHKTQWEVLKEAGNLVGKCIEKRLGNPD
jgi:hypothetical protein